MFELRLACVYYAVYTAAEPMNISFTFIVTRRMLCAADFMGLLLLRVYKENRIKGESRVF